MQTIYIPSIKAGERLDVFLSEYLQKSRSIIQKWIKNKHVLLDRKIAKSHVLIKAGQTIQIEIPLASSAPKIIPPLSILFEDKDLLVIDKQSGVLVHPAHPDDEGTTLVDAILAHNSTIKKVGDPKRPGIVHRLDKAVSGVLLVAKNQLMFEYLKHAFSNQCIEKMYQALVYGILPMDEGTIDFSIERSKTKGMMVAVPRSQERGKNALTYFTVEQRFKTSTLINVFPKTGRTNQIRVHFFSIDHPLVGDPLYKKRVMKHIKPIATDRVFLHACSLTLTLPSGETKSFTSKLPEELQNILQALPLN
ncbi:RNA pseudouridine synthase [Candidatus Uhrbacteria bacterium CG_4_9_14_3_um_filter_36_7]|uniref:Pseudouridine synthase n=1 Tax=Candidatus Uhrbacteria bacterium CG_4_9_14_3_um_filter_36_7 TaxID=1975033 RepID=A0A2M7XGC9_9BACT|nr:MAG: RNA pseudouridine synthase [Candidatus Uhrbacteria bacterium CG_4_9_14_3_um_filter_36_7]